MGRRLKSQSDFAKPKTYSKRANDVTREPFSPFIPLSGQNTEELRNYHFKPFVNEAGPFIPFIPEKK